MGRYEENVLGIVMNFNENIKNERKIAEKSRGCTYIITRFSAANSARVAHFVSCKKHYLGLHFIRSLEDYDKNQLRYEQFCRCTTIIFSTFFFHFYLMFC